MTLLIDRLHEFCDSPSGVAAFLDECEDRGINIPLFKSVPELYLYGRDTTEYLLFLNDVQSADSFRELMSFGVRMNRYAPLLHVILYDETTVPKHPCHEICFDLRRWRLKKMIKATQSQIERTIRGRPDYISDPIRAALHLTNWHFVRHKLRSI